jgi:hypothetical protein
MDPLSIIASILAVVGAVEQLVCLIAKLKRVSRASEEIDSVLTQILSLRRVLQTMARLRSTRPPTYHEDVSTPLTNCKTIIAEIEDIIGGLFAELRVYGTALLRSQIFRIRWIKKNKRIEILTQQLESEKATLVLEVVVDSSCVKLSASREYRS